MHTLRYKRPARFWEEALPLGNGRIGAMVYGGVARERIELNEDTLWAGHPSDEGGYAIRENIGAVRQLIREGRYAEADAKTDLMTGRHSVQSYQLAGNIYLNFANDDDISSYERRLDLTKAVAFSRHKANGTLFTRESFVSAAHQVMAMRMAASVSGEVSFTLSMDSQMRHSLRTDGSTLLLHGSCPYENTSSEVDDIVWERDGRTGIPYVMKVRVAANGGSVTASDNSLTVTAADEACLLIAIKTGFTSWDKDPSVDIVGMEKECDQLLQAAGDAGWEALKAAHCADFDHLYSRMSLDLGTTDDQPADDRPTDEILMQCTNPAENVALTNLVFNYGRYLLISCSRAGTQPANLQGVWNDKVIAPWSSDYHTNINLQMNYWPAQSCNLAECAEPLLSFISDLAISGQRPARKLYDARGWCVHHASDLWRYPYTAGRKAQHAFWPTAAAWLCQHLWEHFAFSGETGFLRECMPVMKGAAAFLLDYMIENDAGGLVTSPSTSPENRFI